MALFYTWSVNPGGTDFWVLPVNNSDGFYGALTTALALLTEPRNWEEFGSVTVQQAIIAASEMFADMFQFPDPVGMIIPYAADPSGLAPGALPCDGASYSTTTYPALFGVIGYAYGGAGSSFNVPDLRGRFPAGVGGTLNGASVNFGTTGGADSHTQTVAEMPSHTHTDTGHAHSDIPAVPNLTTIGPGAPEPTAIPGAGFTGIASASLTNTGGGSAFPTTPPWVGVGYIILTGQP